MVPFALSPIAAEVPAGATVLLTLPVADPARPQPDVARALDAELRALEAHRLYRLLAYALLPDQLQVLLQLPAGGRNAFPDVLQLLKRRTERAAGAAQGRPGEVFWTTHHAVIVVPAGAAEHRIRAEVLASVRPSSVAAWQPGVPAPTEAPTVAAPHPALAAAA